MRFNLCFCFLKFFRVVFFFLIPGNSCTKGSIRSCKVWCDKILHRYPCFYFSCGSCCDSHLDVRSLENHAIRNIYIYIYIWYWFFRALQKGYDYQPWIFLFLFIGLVLFLFAIIVNRKRKEHIYHRF